MAYDRFTDARGPGTPDVKAHYHGRDDIPTGWGPGKVPKSEELQAPEGAEHVGYDNTLSGIPADDVQEAIDFLATAGGSTRTVRLPITLVTTDSVFIVPAGLRAIETRLEIDTTYSPGTTISVGSPASPSLYMGIGDNRPTLPPGPQIIPIDVPAANAVVRVTVGGGPVVGAGAVLLTLSKPEA